MNKPYYAVLEIRKLHGMGSLRKMERHNTRDYAMSHVDENLTYLNRQLVSTGGLSYEERWRQIIADREMSTGKHIVIRKDSVTALDIVTAMSPGAEETLNINIDEWCDKNRQFFEDTFGADNILAMELHMDEVDDTPEGRRGIHIHTLIVPLNDMNRLCAKSLTDRTHLKHYQTEYGKAMKQFGLERGENCSKIHHSDRRRWYHTVAKIARGKAPRINDGETMEQYLSRLDTVFQDQALAAEKLVSEYERRLQLSQTRQAQIFSEYAYAVNLQHILEEEYGGDMRLVNDRLKNYQLMENAVPRKNLDMMIDKMLEKYPPVNNLNFYRKAKKKKHPKWESVPDVTETTNTNPAGTERALLDDEDEKKPVQETVFGEGVDLPDMDNPEDEFWLRGATGEMLDDD